MTAIATTNPHWLYYNGRPAPYRDVVSDLCGAGLNQQQARPFAQTFEPWPAQWWLSADFDDAGSKKDGDGRWITIHAPMPLHLKIGANGDVIAGPGHMVGKNMTDIHKEIGENSS